MRTFDPTPTIMSVLFVAISLFWAACSDPPPADTTGTPTVVKVSGVSLDKSAISIVAGQSQTLTAMIVPSSASDRTLAWSVSPTTVATVSGGKVTGVKAGNATLTVTTVDGGHTATCAVTVTAAGIEVTGVSLDKTSLSIDADGQQTLTARVVPTNASDKAVAWSSSDPAVAKVDQTGKITALKAGETATITVTTRDGAKSARCVVTIAAPDPLNLLTLSNIPDPVFFDYCRRQMSDWDTNEDGKLYADEARAVRSIDVANVYGNAIGSLAGIEYFTGITFLDCSLNALSSLDVSRNTSLAELYCNNNPRLGSLDLSGFTSLTILNCSSCSLEKLDLTRCTRLVDLRCINNNLESIDLSRCTALTYLDVDGNNLSALNLLANRELRGLICDNNRLHELNLSACTALTSLDCFNNSLTGLDLSRNGRLIYLSCDGNALTALDISNNGALESLVCNGNVLEEITIGEANRSLRYLHCSANLLSTAALNAMFEALPPSGTIAIYANPGTKTCDVSIAKEKNWIVMVE
jgi:hypothetical protein